jgi:hypothetical protein
MAMCFHVFPSTLAFSICSRAMLGPSLFHSPSVLCLSYDAYNLSFIQGLPELTEHGVISNHDDSSNHGLLIVIKRRIPM